MLKYQEQQYTGLETWIGILLLHRKISTWKRQYGTWLIHTSFSVFIYLHLTWKHELFCLHIPASDLNDIHKALCHPGVTRIYTLYAQGIFHTRLKMWREHVLDAGYVQSWSPSSIAPHLELWSKLHNLWNDSVWTSKDHCLQLLEIHTSSLLWTSSRAFRLLFSCSNMYSVTVIKCLSYLLSVAIQVIFIQTMVCLFCHMKLRLSHTTGSSY